MHRRIVVIYRYIRKLTTRKILLFMAIFFSGAFAVAFIRFILIDKHETHYHANFALYLNGKRDEFSSFTFYEEVTACSDESHSSPKSRAHMHDKKNSIVHVHDDAVTWGHFFSNIGYVFSDTLIATQMGTYVKNDKKIFTFILNGEKVQNVADKVIGNDDKLLINYGDESIEVITEQYENISEEAHEYNEKTDPVSCSGGKIESFMDRLRRTLLK